MARSRRRRPLHERGRTTDGVSGGTFAPAHSSLPRRRESIDADVCDGVASSASMDSRFRGNDEAHSSPGHPQERSSAFSTTTGCPPAVRNCATLRSSASACASSPTYPRARRSPTCSCHCGRRSSARPSSPYPGEGRDPVGQHLRPCRQDVVTGPRPPPGYGKQRHTPPKTTFLHAPQRSGSPNRSPAHPPNDLAADHETTTTTHCARV